MNIQEKIKDLMQRKKIKNLKQLSIDCEIPYTTLRSIMFEGVSDIRVSTLIKLAKFFEVSTDYILGF